MEKIIDRFVNGQQELIESGYVKRYAENFGYNHLVEKQLARWAKYDAKYYIAEADAEYNFGLDFKIYIWYKADGIQFWKEMTFTSAVTSRGLRRVTFTAKTDKNGYRTFVEYGKEYYDKSESSRPALRACSDAGWVFN